MPLSVLDLRSQSQSREPPRIGTSQKPNKELVDTKAPLPGCTKHTGEDRLRSCPHGAAVSSAGHLAIDHGGPYGLFSRPIRRFQFGVVEVAEDRLAVADDVRRKLAVRVVGELLGDQLVEIPFQLRRPGQELAAGQTPLVPEIPQMEAALEKRFEISRETHRATLRDLLEQAGSPDEMAVAELVDDSLQTVIGCPAIPTEHSPEVAPQGLLDDVESPAGLDHVEGGLFRKRHKSPQPLSDTGDLPAAFVGIDDTTVPHDDLDLSVQRLGLLGCPQKRSQNRRAVQREPEELIQESRDLSIRGAGDLVELNAERYGVGSNLVGGGAKSVRGLHGMPPLRPTATTLAAFAVNAELDDPGSDRRDVSLILVVYRVAGQFAAAVPAARLVDWHIDGLIDFRWQRPKPALAVASARLASGLFGLLLRGSLGKGSCLALLCLLRLLEPLTKLSVLPLQPCNLSIFGSAASAGTSVLSPAPLLLSAP
jgi:hypothetical protein